MRVRCACKTDRGWVVQASAVSGMRLGRAFLILCPQSSPLVSTRSDSFGTRARNFPRYFTPNTMLYNNLPAPQGGWSWVVAVSCGPWRSAPPCPLAPLPAGHLRRRGGDREASPLSVCGAACLAVLIWNQSESPRYLHNTEAKPGQLVLVLSEAEASASSPHSIPYQR